MSRKNNLWKFENYEINYCEPYEDSFYKEVIANFQKNTKKRLFYKFVKRAFDIVASLLALILLSPLLLGIAIMILLFWYFCFNKLFAISINSSLARSKGIPVRIIEDIFIIIVAVIVMISIRWVGILIINSLLILPAASSRNISRNIRQYTFWTIIFAVFSGITGLVISFYALTATGPTIVLISSIIFFVTYLLRKKSED